MAAGWFAVMSHGASRIVETFNTHLMGDDVVVQLNTARESATDEVLMAIKRNLGIVPGLLQHVVIYGPRGFGKSFMTRLIQIKVASLSTGEKPISYVLLPEEQHNLTRNPHLLLEYIAKKLSDQRLGQNRSWTEAAFRWPNPEEEASLWSKAIRELEAELDASLAGKAGLVIAAIENFDVLLATVFKDSVAEQRLRSWLGRNVNRVMLLATGTRTADIDYERPLFQAFQPVRLEPWTNDECIAYFNRRRTVEGRGQLDERATAKVRAIADFIGGNPRLAQLLGDVLDTEDAMTVVETMNTLADRLADYYRHRIEDLPPLARGLIDALIRGGEPCSATDLASRVGASQSDIARVMQDLRQADIIRGMPAPNSKEVLFRVIDRVFVHFYRLRQGEVVARSSPLLTILDFLQTFYSRDEQRAQAIRYLDLNRPDDAMVFSKLAMAGSLSSETRGYQGNFRQRLDLYLGMARSVIDLDCDEVAALLESDQPANLEKHCTSDGLDLEFTRVVRTILRAQIRTRMGLLGNAEQILTQCLAAAKENDSIVVAAEELGSFYESERDDVQASREALTASARCIDTAEQLGLRLLATKSQMLLTSMADDEDATIFWAERTISLAESLGAKWIVALAQAHMAQSLSLIDRYDEAIDLATQSASISSEIGYVSNEAMALNVRAWSLRSLHRAEEAFRDAERAVEVAKTLVEEAQVSTLSMKAWCLSDMDRHEEALNVLDQALLIAFEVANVRQQIMLLHDKVWSLVRLSRFDESLEASEKEIALATEHGDASLVAPAANQQAWALERAGRHEESLAAADKAIVAAIEAGKKDEEARAYFRQGTSLESLGRYEEAISKAELSAKCASEVGDESARIDALLLSAGGFKALGKWKEAHAYALAAVNAAATHNLPSDLAFAILEAMTVAAHVKEQGSVRRFDQWIDLYQSLGEDEVAQPWFWFEDLLGAVARSREWSELDEFVARREQWLASSVPKMSMNVVGTTIANIAVEEGRQVAGEVAQELLRRIAEVARKHRRVRSKWMNDIVGAFAVSCSVPDILRDFAGVVETVGGDAAGLGRMLLLLAEFDASGGVASSLARVDPDVAVWIRRIRHIPDEVSPVQRSSTRRLRLAPKSKGGTRRRSVKE